MSEPEDESRSEAADGPIACEHSPRCSGCTQLSLGSAERASAKRGVVDEALRRYPRLESIETASLTSVEPTLGYRTRAKLAAGPDGALGLYARGSHDVVDIPRCRVLSETVARVVAATRPHALAHPGALSAIDVREVRDAGSTRALVTLIGEETARPELEVIGRQLAQHPDVAGVARSRRDRGAPSLLGATPAVLSGPETVRDRLDASVPYQLVTHGSFVQSHRGVAAALSARIIGRLEHVMAGLNGRRVLELYAGSGGLAMQLCQRGARVLANERFEPALARAVQAAAEQAIMGLDVLPGDADEALERVLARTDARFDAVVVNPPRRGLPPRVRAGIVALAPAAIAYVSCDPNTLARDLDHLALLGYGCDALEPFDMIPLSDAVESLVVLTPRTPPWIAVLHEDEDLLVVDKPPHVPTTPQGEQTVSLLELVQAQRGLAQLAAVHRLDQGTSGVCLLAKRAEAVARLASALRAGTKHYLALARGITRTKGSIQRPVPDGRTLREARTRYARSAVLGGHSLLRVRPDQGRKHQIRRHLAAIGHPLLGDARYGDGATNRHFELRHGLDRPFLHLHRVELSEGGGATRVFEAPLAPDLRIVSERLGRAPTLTRAGELEM